MQRSGGLGAPTLATAVAVSVGLLVLLDMVTNLPFLNALGVLLVEYALIIAAFALLLGLFNLLRVHGRKVQARDEGWPHSAILIVTMLALVLIGLVTGPDGAVMVWTLDNILLPLQSTFFSLLAFFLLSVTYRTLRVVSLESGLLAGSAFVVILGATPVGAWLGPLFTELREAVLTVPAMAGARGLLLGIALGTIITGLRLIFDGPRFFR